MKGQENFRRDRKKSSKDLAQHLAASSGYSPKKLDQKWPLWKGCSHENNSRAKRLRYAKPHKDWSEDGVMSQSLKMLGPITDNMQGEELERVLQPSV